MNDYLTNRFNEFIHEKNSLKHLSMENLHFFELFVKENIYKYFSIFSGDVVPVLASKSNYEGVIYNSDMNHMSDEHYLDLIKTKIEHLKLYDRVNLVILNVIKYFARYDDEQKAEVFRHVSKAFESGEIGSLKELMDLLQSELFSYIYATNREKPLLPEELEYFKATTEHIFKQLEAVFDVHITDVFHLEVDFAEEGSEVNFRYSDNILFG
jgi:hypothetical protein